MPKDRSQLWVQQRASEMLWTRMGSERNLTESQLRRDVWRSRDGRALARLMESPVGSLPVDTLDTDLGGTSDEGLQILAVYLRDGAA